MLNDLLVLKSALARSGVSFETLHPHVKPMGKGAGVVLSVDARGLASSIEVADREWMRNLYRIQRSNHWSFPGFNLPSLLSWNHDKPPAFVSLKNKADRQKTFLSEIALLPASDKILNVADTLQRQARELKAAGLDPGEDGRAFSALLERLHGVTDLPGFVERMRVCAVHLANERYAADADLIEGLLLGKWNPNDGTFDEVKCPAFLDLQDATSFRRRVADPRLRDHLSEIEFSLSASGAQHGMCSLTGVAGPIETEKLPNPILPSLGATYLMSMNAAAPCNSRYGAEGVDIFPVSRSSAEQVNSALLWCVAKERRGRTWATVPAEVKKRGVRDDLLIIYLESLPDTPPEFADLVTGSAGSGVFEELCSRVSDALTAKKVEGSSLIRCVILRRVDPGRVQIQLEYSFSAAELIEGARRWQRAAADTPALRIRIGPRPPYPVEMQRCTGVQWIRGGTEPTDTRSVAFGLVLDVLLRREPRASASAREVLKNVLQRTGGLLAACGNDRLMRKTGRQARAMEGTLAVLPSAISVLLDVLGRTMEVVVNDIAFSLGRLLSMCDLLHREYCVRVRGGQQPPQLLGNGLIPVFTHNPVQGLSRMLAKIRVYRAWSERDGTPLARWANKEIGKIARSLAGKVPAALDEAARAEFLLGYLAASPSATNDKQTSDPENKEAAVGPQ